MNTQFERSTHTTDEWYTPKEIINALGKFDLDPCAPIAPLWQTAETMYNKIERNGMQVRTQRNFNKKTGEDLFGLSIKLEVGHIYCKYPIGHQDYKTITEATKAKKKVMEQLRNGAHLDYGINGTAGINKAEYVKIVD